MARAKKRQKSVVRRAKTANKKQKYVPTSSADVKGKVAKKKSPRAKTVKKAAVKKTVSLKNQTAPQTNAKAKTTKAAATAASSSSQKPAKKGGKKKRTSRNTSVIRRSEEDAFAHMRDIAFAYQDQNMPEFGIEDFDICNVQDLKKVLRHNDRSTAGNRKQLITNILDYMKNGCPPRCPKCGGGRLRFGYKDNKKQYYCPGFMEDDEFQTCSFKVAEIERIKWEDL